MGICASCLGYRDKSSDETTNLLSPNNSYGNYAYGSYTGASQPVSDQDLVREREVLERIVTRATETLIDIMAQNSSHSNIAQNGFGNEDVRVHEYRDILASISPPQLPEMPRPLSPSSVTKDERKWLDDLTIKAEDAIFQMTKVKDVGKLVVTLDFVDA